MELPLPIYESYKIGEQDDFNIVVGLDKNLVAQLEKYSLDETDTELQKNTGDLARFGRGSYEDWYKKDRTPFALMHKNTNALAALVWFGPKPLGKKSMKFEGTKEVTTESNWHTISFRSYPPFRGTGIMKNFSNFVLDFYKKEFPNVLFWTGTDSRNEPFKKLMFSLDFKPNEDASDLNSNWLVMTKKV